MLERDGGLSAKDRYVRHRGFRAQGSADVGPLGLEFLGSRLDFDVAGSDSVDSDADYSLYQDPPSTLK